MAFLDNSGDIILDAVLTETGRHRLAQAAKAGGNAARIISFALGDDDINYSQYDLNNPSGSNYADLEILQTPILEAWTMSNASINYGLLKITDTSLLYLPSLEVNTLYAAANFPAMQPYNGIYYFAVNTTTFNTLTNDEPLGSSSGGMFIGNAGAGPSSPWIFVEGGLNTNQLTKDFVDKDAYITNPGIGNAWYHVGVDNRIYGSVYTNNRSGVFKNSITTNADERADWGVATRSPRPGVTNKVAMANYDFFWAPGRPNNVVVPNANGTADQYSAIAGPGDTIMCFKFSANRGLRTDGTTGGSQDILYTQIGSTRQSSLLLFGSAAGKFYDYIDTMVYVYGNKTGASISIPVRIIRQVL